MLSITTSCLFRSKTTSFQRPCSCIIAAKLFREASTSGCSMPSASSRIFRLRLKYGNASLKFPWLAPHAHWKESLKLLLHSAGKQFKWPDKMVKFYEFNRRKLNSVSSSAFMSTSWNIIKQQPSEHRILICQDTITRFLFVGVWHNKSGLRKNQTTTPIAESAESILLVENDQYLLCSTVA